MTYQAYRPPKDDDVTVKSDDASSIPSSDTTGRLIRPERPRNALASTACLQRTIVPPKQLKMLRPPKQAGLEGGRGIKFLRRDQMEGSASLAPGINVMATSDPAERLLLRDMWHMPTTLEETQASVSVRSVSADRPMRYATKARLALNRERPLDQPLKLLRMDGGVLRAAEVEIERVRSYPLVWAYPCINLPTVGLYLSNRTPEPLRPLNP